MKKIIVPFIICAVAFASCKDADNEKNIEAKEIDETIAKDSMSNIDTSVYDYTLPSPVHVAILLKKAGLKYYPGITLSDEKVNRFKTAHSYLQSLVVGMYSADLAYCILNSQSEETKNYFKACKTLGESIGIASAFEQNETLKRIEKNIQKQDSVLKIMSDIQSEIDNILSNENKGHIAVLAFTGAWIESMHIATYVYKKDSHFPIAQQIVEQMFISENILKALKSNEKKESHITELIKDIQPIYDKFMNLPVIRELMAAHPEQLDTKDIKIDIKELEPVIQDIEKLREKIIQY